MKFTEKLEPFLKEIEKEMGDELKENFKNDKYRNMGAVHFGIALWIRNNILLDKDDVRNLFYDYKIFHHDDISQILTDFLYIYLKEKTLN